MRFAALILSLCLLAMPAFGITIGELNSGGTYIPNEVGSPRTLIHLARPAEADGNVSSLQFLWTGAPAAGCTNAAKIKFMRPAA